MSYQAVYEVTRALRMLLHSQLSAVSASAEVTLLPPGDALPEVSGVNLYLYRVFESPSFKNRPWPGDRRTPGSPNPALGLQLDYLLTPLGKKPDEASFQLGDDAHTMLGIAMLALHENPVLNEVHIPGFDADTVLPDFLRNSFEPLRVCLLPTTTDELSKIWSTINQPYRLSVAYEVALVQLTPTAPPPVAGGIVQRTGVVVVTLTAPRLVSLTPAAGALAHISGGAVVPNQVQVSGFGFSFPGQSPSVAVGGQPAVISAVPPATDQELTISLPVDVESGPLVDVRMALNGRTSIPLAFTIRPWLAGLTPVRSALDPAHGPADLQLALAGSGFTPAPQAVRFDGPGGTQTVTSFGAGGSDSQATVTLPAGLANGLYRVRLVLNDAANSVTNSRTLEIIPRVDVPILRTSAGSADQLTVNGARLNGSDMRLIIDGVTYRAGANGNAVQLVYQLGRTLDPGPHAVQVNVDGHLSRPVELEV